MKWLLRRPVVCIPWRHKRLLVSDAAGRGRIPSLRAIRAGRHDRQSGNRSSNGKARSVWIIGHANAGGQLKAFKMVSKRVVTHTSAALTDHLAVCGSMIDSDIGQCYFLLLALVSHFREYRRGLVGFSSVA